MNENIKAEWSKLVSNQVEFVEQAIAQLAKLQSTAVAQFAIGVDEVGRFAKDSLAQAEKLGAEWRERALEATKRGAEILTPKA